MKIIITLTTLLFVSTTFAKDGSSGCGLGWEILKKNSLVSSFTRAAVNATFSNTLGMTFGTSGCAKHSIVKNEAKAQHFTEANLEQIKIEMALGQGAYVSTLGLLLGCKNEEIFNKSLKENYDAINTKYDIEASELLNNVKDTIHTQNSCNA